MRFRPFILCALAAISVSGCAGLDRETADGLVRDVNNLKTSLAETRSRVEHLDTKVSLLQEKVERQEAAAKERLSPVPAAPPEGLKVVPLGDDAAVKAGDSKAGRAEGPGPQALLPAPADSGVKEAPESPDALYRRGHELLAAGNLAGARMVFMKIVDGYPDYVLIDNALYWTAETYYSERDFTRAIDGFKEIERKHPDRNKAPDAVLKIGLAYLEMGDTGKAKEHLDRVIKRYPRSEAADTARKTVEKMAGKGGE